MFRTTPRYFTAEMTAYVLAKAAAAWLRYLNQDAAENAKANIQFLMR